MDVQNVFIIFLRTLSALICCALTNVMEYIYTTISTCLSVIGWDSAPLCFLVYHAMADIYC